MKNACSISKTAVRTWIWREFRDGMLGHRKAKWAVGERLAKWLGKHEAVDRRVVLQFMDDGLEDLERYLKAMRTAVRTLAQNYGGLRNGGAEKAGTSAGLDKFVVTGIRPHGCAQSGTGGESPEPGKPGPRAERVG